MVKRGKIKKKKKIKKHIHEHLWVASISERETCLRWFVHVQRRPATILVRKSLSIQVSSPPSKRGKQKRTWMEVIRLDLKKCKLSKDLAYNRRE